MDGWMDVPLCYGRKCNVATLEREMFTRPGPTGYICISCLVCNVGIITLYGGGDIRLPLFVTSLLDIGLYCRYNTKIPM